MIRRSVRAALVLVALVAGCDRPCRHDTVFVTLAWDTAPAMIATQYQLTFTVSHVNQSTNATGERTDVTVVEGQVMRLSAHVPGVLTDTVEIDFPDGYPDGKTIDANVFACSAGTCSSTDGTSTQVGLGEQVLQLGSGCGVVTVAIHGPSPSSTTFPVLDSQAGVTKTDVLFVLDNSFEMQATSQALMTAFGSFVQVFESSAMQGSTFDLHLGVITTDYGAGDSGAPGCDVSPGGQAGNLQQVGGFGPSGCSGPVGANYLYAQLGMPGMGMGQNDLPPGRDIVQTLSCMAAVGTSGCMFRQPLEAAYAALHNGLPGNQGFLRADAALAIVFITNGDDASTPTDSNLFDATVAGYGHEDVYRATQYGIVCGETPSLPPYAASGALEFCAPAPNLAGAGPGLEYDVSRYIDYFTNTSTNGGVKLDPSNVALYAIAAPTTPVQVILSDPNTPAGQPYQTCTAISESSSPACVPLVQHSCQATGGGLFGDPPVRLNAVLQAVTDHDTWSICDDNYSATMNAIGGRIAARGVAANCIAARLADVAAPDECTVVDDTVSRDGTLTTTPIPHCEPPGPNQVLPCWGITKNSACIGVSPDGVAITVNRRPGTKPDYTTTSATCTTTSF